MLFHLVEMSNNCKKKGKEGRRKKKKYLTSDLSSGINKRLSPNVKKKKRQVKFAVCNFVCFAESFGCFCFLNRLIKLILGHSMKLSVVIQKESNIITTIPILMCLPFPKDFPKFRKKSVELQMKNFTFSTEQERFEFCKHSEALAPPRVDPTLTLFSYACKHAVSGKSSFPRSCSIGLAHAFLHLQSRSWQSHTVHSGNNRSDCWNSEASSFTTRNAFH